VSNYKREKKIIKLICFHSLSLILLSVWNGAGYYVEVWGRRFEKELDALKREIEATQRASQAAEESAPATRSVSRRDSDVEVDDKKDL
jgi:cell division protein FtsB